MKHPKHPAHLAVGARIVLRQPRWSDADELLALTRRSRKLHAPWMSPLRTAAELDDYLARNRSDDFEALLACDRLSGEILGALTLSQIFRRGFQSAYLGYWVGAGHARQGTMTEAMRLLLDYTFRKLKLHRVEANIQPANTASLRLVARCGFHKEGFSPRYLKVSGRYRDHERWAITREDWRAAKAAKAQARAGTVR
jgi:ribosomal-protein-alanine N-acetyltransferase